MYKRSSAINITQFALAVVVSAAGAAAHAQGANSSNPMVGHYAESSSSSTNSNAANSSYVKPKFSLFGNPTGRYTQGHHGAMSNPATMPYTGNDPVAARQAEHQNIINQMRKHGASAGRINSYREQTEDAPGTTYHTVGGLQMRNDGVTPQQALSNITHNGLMNTPISTNPNHYAQGTYGYYKTHGGRMNFAEWLDSQRR